MACCAAAAFFISQIVLAFESVRRRLFGATTLYPGKSDGPQPLKIERLQPNRRYSVSGALGAELVADSTGSASLTVQLSGRSPVRITPAV